MPGKLRDLFVKDPAARTREDYERVYDDFISCAGGHRVTDLLSVPVNTGNADYYVVLDDFDLIIELKQIQKYLKDDTIDSYFDRLFETGQLRHQFPNVRTGMVVEITPQSLTPKQWRQFYEKFRPSVLQALKKANEQLRDTDRLIPLARPRRVRAVILVNTNDYNLSTDHLYRIVERKTKFEWRKGKFRSLDLAVCCSIDMHKEGGNALHARRIVRTVKDDALIDAAWFVHDRWARYAAAELDLEVTLVPEDAPPTDPDPIEIRPSFKGKLQLRTDDS